MARLVKLGLHDVEEKSWTLEGPPILIGREVIGERVIRFSEDAAQVSKQHARIRKGLFGYTIEDLGSVNGTFVNGERVRKQALRDRDEIRIGPVRLRVLLDEKRRLAPASLKMTKGPLKGESWDLSEQLLVGPGDDANIRLPETESSVSQRHALFQKRGGKYCVRDLGSKNGTQVNGRKIREQILSEGDEIQIGLVRFKLSLSPPVGPGMLRFFKGS